MGVDLRVALGVVVLDVQPVRRVLEGRDVPVQVAQPLVQVWVTGTNVANIALEVLHVHGLGRSRISIFIQESEMKVE